MCYAVFPHAISTQALTHPVSLLQELGPDQHWVSETVFGTAFAVFVLWTFSPFVLQRKRFYTAVMWCRLLMVLVGKLQDAPSHSPA